MNSPSKFSPLFWALIWVILVASAFAFRPLLPVDETRYTSVAWEMWLRGDFLVPHLNGVPYSHKPPLLFWFINAGWGLFGVNDWWPRLVAPGFGLACLFMTSHLSRRLWPDSNAHLSAPLLLLGSYYWGVYTTLTMFDLLLTFWTLVGLTGLVDVWKDRRIRGWTLFAAGLGFGVLSKGPVILIFLLPSAFLAPLWAVGGRKVGWGNWYLGAVAATLIGAVIGLAWALPAGFSGGAAYRDAILLGQSAGRIVDSFAHGKPVWWYGQILPALLLPWLIWPSLLRRIWAALRRRPNGNEIPSTANAGLRLAAVWALSALIILSAISGKRPHYLLPLFPALALAGAFLVSSLSKLPETGRRLDVLPVAGLAILLGVLVMLAPDIGRAVDQVIWTVGVKRWWGLPAIGTGLALILWAPGNLLGRILAMTAVSALFVVTVQAVAKPRLAEAYSLKQLAGYIAGLQKEGYAIANYGKYHGQYNYLGRLTATITETGDGDVVAWLKANPKAKIVSYHYQLDTDVKPEFAQPYRGQFIAIWDAAKVLADPKIAQRR